MVQFLHGSCFPGNFPRHMFGFVVMKEQLQGKTTGLDSSYEKLQKLAQISCNPFWNLTQNRFRTEIEYFMLMSNASTLKINML